MNNQFELLDILTIISFVIAIQNLNLNNTQVEQLQEHLERQDKQYEEILLLLKERR